MQSVEQPEEADALRLIGRFLRSELQLSHDLVAKTVSQIVHRQHSSIEVWRSEFPNESVDILSQCRRSQMWGGASAFVHHPPDAPVIMVASRMRERYFVMSNNSIIKISNVQSPIRSQEIVHRAEPWVVGDHKVGFFNGTGR